MLYPVNEHTGGDEYNDKNDQLFIDLSALHAQGIPEKLKQVLMIFCGTTI